MISKSGFPQVLMHRRTSTPAIVSTRSDLRLSLDWWDNECWCALLDWLKHLCSTNLSCATSSCTNELHHAVRGWLRVKSQSIESLIYPACPPPKVLLISAPGRRIQMIVWTLGSANKIVAQCGVGPLETAPLGGWRRWWTVVYPQDLPGSWWFWRRKGERQTKQFSNSELEITTSMFPVSNDVQREKKCQVRLEPHFRDWYSSSLGVSDWVVTSPTF